MGGKAPKIATNKENMFPYVLPNNDLVLFIY